jgi:hypothetical protein
VLVFAQKGSQPRRRARASAQGRDAVDVAPQHAQRLGAILRGQWVDHGVVSTGTFRNHAPVVDTGNPNCRAISRMVDPARRNSIARSRRRFPLRSALRSLFAKRFFVVAN